MLERERETHLAGSASFGFVGEDLLFVYGNNLFLRVLEVENYGEGEVKVVIGFTITVEHC